MFKFSKRKDFNSNEEYMEWFNKFREDCEAEYDKWYERNAKLSIADREPAPENNYVLEQRVYNAESNKDKIISRYIKMAGLLPKKYNIVLDKHPNEDVYARLNEIVTNFDVLYNEEKNLLFWSESPGTGKTVSASKFGLAFIQWWVDKEISEAYEKKNCQSLSYIANQDCNRIGDPGIVCFISVNELLFLRKDFSNQESQKAAKEFENKIKACPLVIWDDIGLGELSAYDKEYLTMLIDWRLNQYNKINVYTSNLSEGQLFNAIGARLYSRIHENTEVIEFKGGDKR